jgi:pyruvoyl-dependent arginine decarboxylase (PvlArgDC)
MVAFPIVWKNPNPSAGTSFSCFGYFREQLTFHKNKCAEKIVKKIAEMLKILA